MNRWSYFLGLCLILAISFTLLAQEVTPEPTNDTTPIDTGISPLNVYFNTDKLEVLLGEPFEIQLIAELPEGYSISAWNENPLDEPFEIVDAGELEIIQQGTLQIQRQILKVVLWEIGNQTTPEVFLTYTSPAGTAQRTPITSITVSGKSTLVEGDLSLRPLKPLIDLPYIPPIIFLIPIIAFLVIIWIIRNFRFSKRLQQAFANPNSPLQKAIIELKHLMDTNLDAETAYPLIADEMRTYLGSQFDIRATDMTTLELMKTLRGNRTFSDTLCYSLEQFLTQADLVKFANHKPAISTQKIVDFAIHWIESAEKTRIAHE